MIEIAARENGVRCIEVGHWTVGGCACDTLQLLLFLAHAKKQKRRQRTVEDMARMRKRGHRDCLRSRALAEPDPPLTGLSRSWKCRRWSRCTMLLQRLIPKSPPPDHAQHRSIPSAHTRKCLGSHSSGLLKFSTTAYNPPITSDTTNILDEAVS